MSATIKSGIVRWEAGNEPGNDPAWATQPPSGNWPRGVGKAVKFDRPFDHDIEVAISLCAVAPGVPRGALPSISVLADNVKKDGFTFCIFTTDKFTFGEVMASWIAYVK